MMGLRPANGRQTRKRARQLFQVLSPRPQWARKTRTDRTEAARGLLLRDAGSDDPQRAGKTPHPHLRSTPGGSSDTPGVGFRVDARPALSHIRGRFSRPRLVRARCPPSPSEFRGRGNPGEEIRTPVAQRWEVWLYNVGVSRLTGLAPEADFSHSSDEFGGADRNVRRSCFPIPYWKVVEGVGELFISRP